MLFALWRRIPKPADFPPILEEQTRSQASFSIPLQPKLLGLLFHVFDHHIVDGAEL